MTLPLVAWDRCNNNCLMPQGIPEVANGGKASLAERAKRLAPCFSMGGRRMHRIFFRRGTAGEILILDHATAAARQRDLQYAHWTSFVGYAPVGRFLLQDRKNASDVLPWPFVMSFLDTFLTLSRQGYSVETFEGSRCSSHIFASRAKSPRR